MPCNCQTYSLRGAAGHVRKLVRSVSKCMGCVQFTTSDVPTITARGWRDDRRIERPKIGASHARGLCQAQQSVRFFILMEGQLCEWVRLQVTVFHLFFLTPKRCVVVLWPSIYRRLIIENLWLPAMGQGTVSGRTPQSTNSSARTVHRY